jgi:hypothetical protein
VADTKISALSAASAGAAANEFAINEAGTSKKLTLAQIEAYLETRGLPRVVQLTGQHSIASTTGTKVTGLDMTLEAGTYIFTYALIIRQATSTSDAPQFGVNFTGTATKQNFHLRFADATTAITAAVHIMDNVGIKAAGFIDGMAHNAFSTTAPNMGTTIGVAATGADILAWIEGLMVVTVGGNLELWRAAEGANASTTEVGSSLVVVRTA